IHLCSLKCSGPSRARGAVQTGGARRRYILDLAGRSRKSPYTRSPLAKVKVSMPEAVIVSAVRTPIGTARKGSLADTTAEELAQLVLEESVHRSGLAPELVDDVFFAESLSG